jgi:hypothetical protein
VLCALMTRCCNYCGARSTWVSRHLIIISFFFFVLRWSSGSRGQAARKDLREWKLGVTARKTGYRLMSIVLIPFTEKHQQNFPFFFFFSRVDNLKIMEIIWGSTYFFPPPQTIRKEGVHSVCLDTSN